MTTDTELRELLAKAEAERDSAQEHLAYHLADYQLNSEPTGDIAVDIAVWARRQRDRADAAEAKLTALREAIAELAHDLHTLANKAPATRIGFADVESGVRALLDQTGGEQ